MGRAVEKPRSASSSTSTGGTGAVARTSRQIALHEEALKRIDAKHEQLRDHAERRMKMLADIPTQTRTVATAYM